MAQSSSEFILQWNTSSLISHWGEFKNYIFNKKPLVAAIQETRFLDSDSVNYNFNISGYSLYTNNVNETPRRGGSALYISNKLLHHQISLQTTLNAVGASIKIAQQEISILSIYLSPHPSSHLPVNDLRQLLSQIPHPCLIMGDFNSYNLAWGSAYTNTRGTQLLNVMETFDLICINNRTPTFMRTRNGRVVHSVIDLAFTDTNTATLFYQHVEDDPLFSDHYPIHYELQVPSGQANFNFLPRWNFSKADWASFQKHIDESSPSPPLDINNFLNVILAAAHQYIPHTRPPRDKRNAPWWNADCQRALAVRRRALRVFNRCICDVHENSYRRAIYEANETIKKAKLESWQSFSSNFNRFTPLSKIWSLLRSFSNKRSATYKIPHLHINNTHYTVPLDVATQFAQHYAQISSAQQYTQEQQHTYNTTLDTLSFHSSNTEKYNQTFDITEPKYSVSQCGNTSVGPD